MGFPGGIRKFYTDWVGGILFRSSLGWQITVQIAFVQNYATVCSSVSEALSYLKKQRIKQLHLWWRSGDAF